MAYNWSKAKGDGTETTAEIMAIVHCCRETVYRRARVNSGFDFKKIPANERAQRHGGKQRGRQLSASAVYPEVEPERKPLEGFSSAPSNYVLDIYGGLL